MLPPRDWKPCAECGVSLPPEEFDYRHSSCSLCRAKRRLRKLEMELDQIQRTRDARAGRQARLEMQVVEAQAVGGT